MTPGPLIIVSGPSGSGKSTLIRRLLQTERRFPLRLAVSATTRPPRPGEEDGVHYHFWSPERFQQELTRGAFLEHAIIHGAHSYGTPRDEVDPYREQGIGVILDIDVQGAAQIREQYPHHLSIFVSLPTWTLYEERMRQRGAESEAEILRRLETARKELNHVNDYQHLIMNNDLERAVTDFRDLIANYWAARRDH